jgi:hypothetical protein
LFFAFSFIFKTFNLQNFLNQLGALLGVLEAQDTQPTLGNQRDRGREGLASYWTAGVRLAAQMRLELQALN